MMMSKIKFDVNMMTLTVSKKFWNNASVPFSPEYETIKRILQDYPRCRIELRQTASHHNPYRNPSYNMMEAYIQTQPNADELMNEFWKVRDFANTSRTGYNFVRNWFMERCPMDVRFDSSCHEEIALVA